MDKMETKEAVEIWKRTVETQMHFNEMSTKSRQLGLTLVVAALGLSAVLLGRGDDFSLAIPVCSIVIRLNVAVLIMLASAVGMYGVQQLDLGVYHQMLRGAVKFGEEFEERNLIGPMSTPQGMTQLISVYSRNTSVIKQDSGKYVGSDADKKLAGNKLQRFYRLMIISILAMAVAMFVITQFSTIQPGRPSTVSNVVAP